LTLRRIVFVTANAGKHREAAELLGGVGVECEMRAVKLPEPQADALEEVARAKVAAARVALGGEPFFVDDAGIFVDALKGFPGVYSAYVLKTVGTGGVLKLLDGVADRRARFEAVIGFWSEATGERYFKGVSRGAVAPAARDAGHGFGFDPIFVPEGGTRTFAEMPDREKNLVSHRGRALRDFVAFLAGKDTL
jgi:XTP/dITP diphosphohydrolase